MYRLWAYKIGKCFQEKLSIIKSYGICWVSISSAIRLIDSKIVTKRY